MIETQDIRDLFKIESSTDRRIELKVLLNKRNQLLLIENLQNTYKQISLFIPIVS